MEVRILGGGSVRAPLFPPFVIPLSLLFPLSPLPAASVVSHFPAGPIWVLELRVELGKLEEREGRGDRREWGYQGERGERWETPARPLAKPLSLLSPPFAVSEFTVVSHFPA